MVVGRDQRLFAAHEDVLCRSPFFAASLKDQFFEAGAKKVKLPDEYVKTLPKVLTSSTHTIQRTRNTILHPRIPLQG